MRPTSPTGFSKDRTLGRRVGSLALVLGLVALLLPGTSLPSALAHPVTPLRAPLGASETMGDHPTIGPEMRNGAPVPAVSQNITPLFFSNDWSVGNSSSTNLTCKSPTGWCYEMSQNPSLVNLSNGDMGLGFSAITNFSSATPCGAGANITSRIAWSSSSDGGKSFTPLQYIGNSGPSGCPFYDGIEPSFTADGSGEIFGAFVATNATAAQMFTTTAPGVYGSGRPVLDYVYRPYDALALVTSDSNGTNWSTMRILVNGSNIAAPHVAAFGDSVYIVYTNISNVSTVLPGASTDPTKLQFVYSTDGGATWTGPVAVPAGIAGASASQYNNAMDPSISVSPSGEIAVAYATDRTCYAFCTAYNTVYADDIVVSLSTSNGSSWSAPKVAAKHAAEFMYNSANYGGPGVWEGAIGTTVAWGSDTDLYVAWSQAENMSLTDQYASQLDWANSGIYSSASTSTGASWTAASVTGPLPGLDYNQEVFGFGYFNPALGVHNGTVFLAYSYYNWTNGGTGRNSYTQNAYGNGNGEWITTSANGVAWTSPSIIEYDPAGSGITDFDYWGYLGSIAFDAQGQPIVAYAMQTAFLLFSTAIDLPVALMVGTVYRGPTTDVTVEETGLAPGTLWSAQIEGSTYSTTASMLNITDAPVGRAFYIVWPGPVVLTEYRTAVMPEISTAPIFVATGPSTDVFNFTTFYGLQFFADPTDTPGLTIETSDFNQNGGYQFYWYWAEQIYAFGNYYYSYGAMFPWYFPAGSWLNFSAGTNGNSYYYGAGFVGYWSGTGAGSFNGSATVVRLHVEGPINETAWMAAYGSYSEGVAAPQLPNSSSFSFSLGGGSYSGAGGSTVIVQNLTTGGYEITNISATTARPGWEYFGYSDDGNPIVIPNTPSVNLSFAAVNLSSAPGQVSFHAAGLPLGASWQLDFNGTEYSASIPWINVTTRAGAFPVEAYPSVAPAANESFVPTGVASDGNVVVGQTYDVNFTPAYKVELAESSGGHLSVSPGNYFLAPGASLTVNATPSSGYRFAGWTGTGAGAVTTSALSANLTALGPIVESASFVPLVLDRFNVTIDETGVPNGTAWSVDLDGVGYSSSTSQLVVPNELSCTFSGAAGSYSLAVPFAHANASGVRYVPISVPQTVCGGGATATVQFSPEYAVSVTAGTGGTVAATPSAGGSTSSPYWIPSGGSISFSPTPSTDDTFVGWLGTGVGSYSGTGADEEVSPTVGPLSEIAEFTPTVAPAPVRYSATFVENLAFLPGTTWTLTNATASFSSTSNEIVVPDLAPGSYPFTVGTAIAPSGTARYVPTSGTVTAAVHSNASWPVGFTAQFWISVSAVGPGDAAPASAWVPSGAQLSLSATPTGAALFDGWAGTGPGSYSGAEENTTVTISAPITEVASFALVPPALTTPASSTTSPWADPIVWAGLAAVGLVIGVVVGARLGRRPPVASAPPPAPEEPPRGVPEYDEGTGEGSVP